MKLLKIVLAIVVPPLGVYLTVGVGIPLLINILLTLLGWLPGAIHALWILSKQTESVNP